MQLWFCLILRTAEQPLMTAKMREELEKSKMEKYNRVRKMTILYILNFVDT